MDENFYIKNGYYIYINDDDSDRYICKVIMMMMMMMAWKCKVFLERKVFPVHEYI